ncbi:MAG: hypothetical protein J3Q66DRAFT_361113 [Benniella sp.]|nr:MAG: hypothetical protein J3Q66DRAFT_361113 [Benniella sp.]
MTPGLQLKVWNWVKLSILLSQIIGWTLNMSLLLAMIRNGEASKTNTPSYPETSVKGPGPLAPAVSCVPVA